MRLLVTGGRDYRLTDADRKFLNDFHAAYGVTLLLHGGCRGADLDAAAWAEANDIATKAFIPRWANLGKKAGPLRNAEMVQEADYAIAFPGGKGTQNMLRQAKEHGVRIISKNRH